MTDRWLMFPGRVRLCVPDEGYYAVDCRTGRWYLTGDRRLGCWFVDRECAEWVAELRGFSRFTVEPVK
jgi:hypothetical protein